MNKENTIISLCEITAKVAEHFGWTEPADCICGAGYFNHISTSDKIIAFIEKAVVEKIEREKGNG